MARIQNILKSLKHDRSYVKAGVTGAKAVAVRPPEEGAPQTEPMTNAKLAVIHEFGTDYPGPPARPFVHPSFILHLETYRKRLQDLVREAVYEGKISYPKALGLIGQEMSRDMREYIRSQPAEWPGLAPSTWLRKFQKGRGGDPKILIDTGRLLASITYAVVLDSTSGIALPAVDDPNASGA